MSSKEKQVAVEAVYNMFSYASLHVCLFHISKLFEGFSVSNFSRFCDCLEHYENYRSKDFVVMADLYTEERIQQIFSDSRCLMKPDVFVSNGMITIYTHGVGWYVFHDMETLKTVSEWALHKYVQYDTLFKTCGIDIDPYEEFRKCVSNKKAVNSRRNKIPRSTQRVYDA